jgi:hypothetical protein
MALIAPFAQVARSTNRSTPYRGDHHMPATERYCHLADQRMPPPVAEAEGKPNVANRRATGS